MKQMKFKMSTMEEVKTEMQKIYPVLKENYRIQSGYNPSGNVFSIGQN